MTTDTLEIALLPGKGRGYRSTCDIAAGSVVHVSDPYATTVSQEWIPETCMWCFSFSYPKRQKIKAINEEEQANLLKDWGNSDKRKQPNKRKCMPKSLIKDVLFCSDDCKNQFKCSFPYWGDILAMNYRFELEYINSRQMDENISILSVDTAPLMKIGKWTNVHNDEDLSQWLDETWDILTENLDLYKEIEDTDRAMCRLIAACILRKNNEQQPEDPDLKFSDLLVIQNNELIHFRTHFSANTLYPEHAQELPSISQLDAGTQRQVLLRLLPKQVLEVMALYSFFARALTTPKANVTIPELKSVNNILFRSIFFRERSNSFGLWEMSSIGESGVNDGVSDDMELLGWGIYPSAVYFNHSCDANVVKIRDGRQIKFIARRMIEKGEEVCISYGNVGEDLNARRSRLLEHYQFICQCSRCIHEDKIRTMTRS